MYIQLYFRTLVLASTVIVEMMHKKTDLLQNTGFNESNNMAVKTISE